MSNTKRKFLPVECTKESYVVWFGNDWFKVKAISPEEAALIARNRYGVHGNKQVKCKVQGPEGGEFLASDHSAKRIDPFDSLFGKSYSEWQPGD